MMDAYNIDAKQLCMVEANMSKSKSVGMLQTTYRCKDILCLSYQSNSGPSKFIHGCYYPFNYFCIT